MEIRAQDMVPVPIREFLTAKIVPVDVYIRLSDDKFVQLFKQGEEMQMDRIQAYKDKSIDVLYVPKNQYSPYVEQHIQIAGILLLREEVEARQKSAIINRMGSAVLKEIEAMGFSAETFARAKTVTRSTIELVESKLSLKDLLESITSGADEVASHSMAVSAVSVMISHEMGWELDANIEKLALGALLHDIGKKELPPDLLSKPRAQMTFEEIAHYESHCWRGVQILQSIGVVPDDVLRVVHEHHERGAGQGFPRRLNHSRIHPLAKVVAVANSFCELTMKNPNCPQAKSPEAAVTYVESVMGQPFAKDVFRALKEMVQNGEYGKKSA